MKEKIIEYAKKIANPSINRLDQILAQSRLVSLGIGYLPHSKFAINPDAIEVILNEIIVNRRAKIVEFGSGISTIYVAKILSKGDKKNNFISFEHDKDWIRVLSDILKKEEVFDCVDIVHAKLNQAHGFYNKTGRDFYDFDIIQSKLAGADDIDCVIVDGPPAYMNRGGLSRLPALPLIKDYLSDEFSVFLDDVNRNGEKEIFEHYQSLFNFGYTTVKSNMAYMRKGGGFSVA